MRASTFLAAGAFASACAAFSLSELEPLSDNEVTDSCRSAYNSNITGCDVSTFTSHRACPSSCIAGLTKLQAAGQEACSDAFAVDLGIMTLLQQLQQGTLISALCGTSSSGSSSASASASAMPAVVSSAASASASTTSAASTAAASTAAASTSAASTSTAQSSTVSQQASSADYSGTLVASSIDLSTPAPSFSGVMTLSTSYTAALTTAFSLVSDTANPTTGLALDLSPEPTNASGQVEGKSGAIVMDSATPTAMAQGGLATAATNGTEATSSNAYAYLFASSTASGASASASGAVKTEQSVAAAALPGRWPAAAAALVCAWLVL